MHEKSFCLLTFVLVGYSGRHTPRPPPPPPLRRSGRSDILCASRYQLLVQGWLGNNEHVSKSLVVRYRASGAGGDRQAGVTIESIPTPHPVARQAFFIPLHRRVQAQDDSIEDVVRPKSQACEPCHDETGRTACTSPVSYLIIAPRLPGVYSSLRQGPPMASASLTYARLQATRRTANTCSISPGPRVSWR